MMCLNCLHRLPNCLLPVLIMCAAVSEEAAASYILVGAQTRIMCWGRARSSSSELVDTTHSTTEPASGGRHACGTAVPISPRTTRPSSTERLHEVAVGHHAWAFATRCHSRRAILVATWNAAVATGGQHGASAAEAQTRHVC